jgi:hypothetical protein
MLKKPEPSKPEDELTKQLRAAVRKRRPWTLRGRLVVLAVVLVPIAWFVWLIFPEPAPPRVTVIACDQVGLSGQDVDVTAWLETADQTENRVRLGGYPLLFEEGQTPPPADKEPRQIATVSGDGGEASSTWRFPADRSLAEVLVRYEGDRRRRAANDRARVFLWPAQTSLLVVDVQEALTREDSAGWRTTNILDIPARPGAIKALHTARAAGFQIVYLATQAERPLFYRKMRGWVGNALTTKEPVPLGPVLGRPTYGPEATESAGREAVLRRLKETFHGPIVAVVGSSEAAAVCQALAVSAILLGDADAPPEVIRVKSWEAVVQKLPKAKGP